jgi:hypothetical protein
MTVFVGTDSAKTRRSLTVAGKDYAYYSISAADGPPDGTRRLQPSVITLENNENFSPAAEKRTGLGRGVGCADSLERTRLTDEIPANRENIRYLGRNPPSQAKRHREYQAFSDHSRSMRQIYNREKVFRI